MPSWIMWQWAGVPVNTILNRRWTQLINHANYKNNSNDSPICQTLFPPWRACAIQRQFRLGMASYRKSLLTLHNMLKMCFLCFMNTNISAWDANCLFAINAQIAICASGEISSSVMVSFSFALRIRPSTNINVDLDSLKVSLNRFLL